MINIIKKYIDSNKSFCVATLVNIKGSAPQNQGAKIIVSSDGSIEGTVGGGKIENRVIEYSKSILNGDETKQFFFETWNLQKDIGMTCGGVVSVYFEVFNKCPWNIVIFGAGHVGQSLVKVLSNLNCNLTIVDNREEWLSKVAPAENVKTIHREQISTYVKEIPKNSFVLSVTKGHSDDLQVLKEILPNGLVFPYLGVIGSKSKRNSIEKELLKNNIENMDFLCPIGLPIGDNSPEEIAMSVASQLLEYRDNFFDAKKK